MAFMPQKDSYTKLHRDVQVSSPMKELEYMLRRLAHFDFEKDESWLEAVDVDV